MSDQVPSVSTCPDAAASGSDAYLEQDHSNDALTTRLQPLWDELQRLKSKINAFGSLLEGQRGQCERGQRDLTRALTGLRVQLGAGSIDPMDDIGMLLDPGHGEQTDGEAGSEAGDVSGDEAECSGGGAGFAVAFQAKAGGGAAEPLAAHSESDQLPAFRERLLNIRRSIEERPWPSPCRTATAPHEALEKIELKAGEHTPLPEVGTPPVATVSRVEVLKHAEETLPRDEQRQQQVAQPHFEEEQEATPLASVVNDKPDETELTAADVGDSPFEAMHRARDELRQMAAEECLRAATDLQDVLQEVSFEVVEATLHQQRAEIEAEVLAWRKEKTADWRQEWLKELKQDLADLKESMSLKAEMPEPCPEQACDGEDVPPHVGRTSSMAAELHDLRAEAKVNADECKLVASRVELLERQMALGRENVRCRASTAQPSDTTASPVSRRATARTPSICRLRSASRVGVSRIFCLSVPRASSPP